MARRARSRLTALLRVPVPAGPERLRRGPFRPEAFSSQARSPWLTSRLGVALGLCFGLCFITGLLSHAIQHPPAWFSWPARPVALYRVTQGVHVAAGLAAIPLFSVKVWSVYPRLFAWPPARSLGHALDRLSIAVLLGAALFQIVTGLLNIVHGYALMPWGFLPTHYWVAWLAVGAIVLHIAVKLPIIRDGLRRSARPAISTVDGGLTRRGVLVAAGAAVAAVTVTTVGQTVQQLSRASVLGPRQPDIGPQSLPVNMSAIGAGVTAAARDPQYRLVLTGPSGRRSLTLAELAALPQHTADLPITCVDGWSAGASWTGVRLSELVGLVGGSAQDSVLVESLQTTGSYTSSIVDSSHLADPLTLLATQVNGEPLHIDHGYPCRLIAPNRPGVLQTKWVRAVTVT